MCSGSLIGGKTGTRIWKLLYKSSGGVVIFVYIQYSTVFVRETVKFQHVFLSHITQGNNLED